MKKAFLLIVLKVIVGCSSTDDCTKTISIPSRSIITPSGAAYIPGTTLLVPCDYVETPIQEQASLTNFTYEVLNFNFTPNTGQNTNRLKFDIKLNNQNNYNVNGVAYISLNTDGLVSSSVFTNGTTSACNQINANSSCIFSYDKESSLNTGIIQSIQIVNVRYYTN